MMIALCYQKKRHLLQFWPMTMIQTKSSVTDKTQDKTASQYKSIWYPITMDVHTWNIASKSTPKKIDLFCKRNCGEHTSSVSDHFFRCNCFYIPKNSSFPENWEQLLNFSDSSNLPLPAVLVLIIGVLMHLIISLYLAKVSPWTWLLQMQVIKDAHGLDIALDSHGWIK